MIRQDMLGLSESLSGILKQDFMKLETDTFRVKEVAAAGLAPYKGLFRNIIDKEGRAELVKNYL